MNCIVCLSHCRWMCSNGEKRQLQIARCWWRVVCKQLIDTLRWFYFVCVFFRRSSSIRSHTSKNSDIIFVTVLKWMKHQSRNTRIDVFWNYVHFYIGLATFHRIHANVVDNGTLSNSTYSEAQPIVLLRDTNGKNESEFFFNSDYSMVSAKTHGLKFWSIRWFNSSISRDFVRFGWFNIWREREKKIRSNLRTI